MATYYIDPENGKNENSGLSENEPILTNENLDVAPGDKVLFKRGSLIRGAVHNKPGTADKPIYYGAYGEGAMPTFSASKDLKDEKFWKEIQKNIWVCEEFDWVEMCNIIFNDGDLFGTLKWSIDEMTEQGDYFSNGLGETVMSFRDGREIKNQKIYLYSKENPAKHYKSIEGVFIGPKTLAENGENMIIENLRFINAFCGISGDRPTRNLTIKNCVFQNIGGAVWSFDRKIRCGNGVEAWDVAENFSVTGCYFDNIYDSAVTHQGGKNCQPAKNMIFNNNVFLRCGMGALEQRDIVPLHAEFNGNICAYAGEGFSKLGEEMPRFSEIWPEPMGHHAFMWRMKAPTEGGHQEIKNNIFVDAPYGAAIFSVCAPEADEQFIIEGNTYSGNFELVNQLYGKKYKTFDDYKGVEKDAKFKNVDVEKEIADWKKRNNMEF